VWVRRCLSLSFSPRVCGKLVNAILKEGDHTIQDSLGKKLADKYSILDIYAPSRSGEKRRWRELIMYNEGVLIYVNQSNWGCWP